MVANGIAPGVIASLSAINMLFRAAKTTVADPLPSKFGQRVMASRIGSFGYALN